MRATKKIQTRCVPLLVFVCCCFSQYFYASSAIQAAHGTIALVPLNGFTRPVQVEFLDKPQLILDNYAVVAVPLDTQAGEYPVVVNSGNTQSTIAIRVLDKQYPEEHITVADKEQVSPSQPTLDRIARESARMRKAYSRVSAQPDDLLPILQPVEGRNSGVFGSKRFFNGQPRNPHSGIDWAAPAGTPIQNPAPGQVVVVGDFFFNGKTVLIDHGGGFVSMMCHMSEILVAEGDHIGRGAVIGKVGTTGRSTGPHLHWTVSLGGERTDPAVFMAVLNSLVE